jgi:hypothetical protein
MKAEELADWFEEPSREPFGVDWCGRVWTAAGSGCRLDISGSEGWGFKSSRARRLKSVRPARELLDAWEPTGHTTAQQVLNLRSQPGEHPNLP